MPKSHAMPIRLCHQPGKNDQISPISRQWELLQLLSNEKEGSTVDELADRIGVSSKTIRRHLLFFKHLGFDLQATENVFGLKRWRIRHIFETLTTKQKQYRYIRDELGTLIGQSRSIGDSRLVADLEGIYKKLGKKK